MILITVTFLSHNFLVILQGSSIYFFFPVYFFTVVRWVGKVHYWAVFLFIISRSSLLAEKSLIIDRIINRLLTYAEENAGSVDMNTK